MRPALLLAAMLAAAVPAAATPHDTPPPPAVTTPDGPRSFDVTGRFFAEADRVVLELAGARLELRMLGDGAGPPPAPPASAHDFRATFSLDGRATSFLLRVVPPPEAAPDAARP
jgi:hypothetical protein